MLAPILAQGSLRKVPSPTVPRLASANEFPVDLVKCRFRFRSPGLGPQVLHV